jgi:hypothetical protein
MFQKLFQRVSESPTNPHEPTVVKEFDVAELYQGPASTDGELAKPQPLDEKLRQAYFWVVNHAVISPFYDIEYNDPGQTPQTFVFGDSHSTVTLPSGRVIARSSCCRC